MNSSKNLDTIKTISKNESKNAIPSSILTEFHIKEIDTGLKRLKELELIHKLESINQ